MDATVVPPFPFTWVAFVSLANVPLTMSDVGCELVPPDDDVDEPPEEEVVDDEEPDDDEDDGPGGDVESEEHATIPARLVTTTEAKTKVVRILRVYLTSRRSPVSRALPPKS